MKKYIVMVAMLFAAVTGFAQEEVKPKDKGEMKFEKTRHNFGVFSVDTAVVTHEFVFTNVGKSHLSSIRLMHRADVPYPNIHSSLSCLATRERLPLHTTAKDAVPVCFAKASPYTTTDASRLYVYI